MRDAPERIWLLDWPVFRHKSMWAACDEYPVDPEPDELDVEYIRSDLARLPEDLVERLRHIISSQRYVNGLYVDILAWHEQQGGGK